VSGRPFQERRRRGEARKHRLASTKTKGTISVVNSRQNNERTRHVRYGSEVPNKDINQSKLRFLI
jgi:hypothetical protein